MGGLTCECGYEETHACFCETETMAQIIECGNKDCVCSCHYGDY